MIPPRLFFCRITSIEIKMRHKVQYTLQVLIILIVLAAIGSSAYWFFVYIPAEVSATFGEADASLEKSKKLLLSVKLFFNKDLLLTTAATENKPQVFIIQPGETGAQIAASLREEGLISDEASFIDYLVYKGIDRLLQAGVHLIPVGVNPKAIADKLYDSNPEDVTFAFLPGWRAEEIADLLPNSGLNITPSDFTAYIKNPPEGIASNVFPQAVQLEGMLWAGEYEVERDISLSEMISLFTQTFMERLPENFEMLARKRGLSPYEAIILASIIEKEMLIPDEGPLIASVFLNRLAAGMPLQSDPTVQYALGYDVVSGTWWKNPLNAEDLLITSPYNTYQNIGLPPAPICNPGLNALLAVVNAEKSEYFYFRSACDGSGGHVFTHTYEEHLSVACP